MRGQTPNNRVVWPLHDRVAPPDVQVRHDRVAPSDVQVRSVQGPINLEGVTSFDEALNQGFFALLG